MANRLRVLTGIKPTGAPHLGNYIGAIKPAIELSASADVEGYFFLADYHALTGGGSPEAVTQATLDVAATWLALGLDPTRVNFYRQSDLPETLELTWLLSCVASKGQLNRAHAYKAAVDANVARGQDPDVGVGMGLYLYPVLMAADILLFNANVVPVGKDQVQHIEIARDLASRFNLQYGADYLILPEAKIDAGGAVLLGTDGRKMSKSYGNTIPLFLSADALREQIMKVVTNALPPGASKDTDCALFQLYSAFATDAESAAMAQSYAAGIAWGEAKAQCFAVIDRALAPARQRYAELMANPAQVEQILVAGAEKLRPQAMALLRTLRQAVGLRALTTQHVAIKSADPPEIDGPSVRARRAGKTARLINLGAKGFKLLAADGPILVSGDGALPADLSTVRWVNDAAAGCVRLTDAAGTPLGQSASVAADALENLRLQIDQAWTEAIA